MEITYIKLKRIYEQQKLVAVADVTIDDLIVIHGIKVLSNRDNGLFIAMPSKKNPNGTFSDIVHPISVAARNIFEKLLFPATEKMIKEKRNSLQYKLTRENTRDIIEQNLNDFTIVEEDGMRFVDESVKDEILSWLNS
jgi:stage V sporulation protein G